MEQRVFLDPVATDKWIAIVTALFGTPVPSSAKYKSLSELDESIVRRLLVLGLYFIKHDQISLTKQVERVSTLTKTSDLRDFVGQCAAPLGAAPESADEIVRYIVFEVLKPRTRRPVMEDGTLGEPETLTLARQVGMNGISLAEDTILTLARLDDTLLAKGTDKLNLADYCFKMAIDNHEIDAAISSLEVIRNTIGQEADWLKMKTEAVAIDFASMDMDKLNEELAERREAYPKLREKLVNHYQGVDKIADGAMQESLDSKGQLETADDLVNQCIGGYGKLIDACKRLYDQIRESAKVEFQPRNRELCDFHREVFGQMGKLSIGKLCDIADVILTPGILSKDAWRLLPSGLLCDSDPKPPAKKEDEFVDMSEEPILTDEEHPEEPLDTAAFEKAVESYLLAHGGQALLSEITRESNDVSRAYLMNSRYLDKVFFERATDGNAAFYAVETGPLTRLDNGALATDVRVELEGGKA